MATAGIVVLVMAGRSLLNRTASDPAPTVATLASRFPISAVSLALAEPIERGEFPPQIAVAAAPDKNLQGPPSPGPVVQVTYTIDWPLQAFVHSVWNQYKPDYAAFAAVDPATGRIQVLSSYTREENALGNLALRSIFPAASVFKIVTAAAAMEVGAIQPDTKIPYTGRDHTLYRRQVFPKDGVVHGARELTLKDAFARSVNTVFARVGLDWVGGDKLEEYARRFRFREPFATDVPIGMGTLSVQPDDPWSVAEIASGFNRVVRLSPVHGAAIAGTIANHGVMMEPFLVDTLAFGDDGSAQVVSPRRLGSVITPQTASAMREMMEETVRSGTPAKAFRNFRRLAFPGFSVGGKTGSLTSELPQGKCDWFVGYVMGPRRSLAYAILTVNRDKWRVKSAAVAEMVVRQFFQEHAASRRSRALTTRK